MQEMMEVSKEEDFIVNNDNLKLETIPKDVDSGCTPTLFCKTWNLKSILVTVRSSALNEMH